MFGKPDMDDAVSEAASDPHVHLFDVRSVQEYEAGHIPGATRLTNESLEQLVGDRSDTIYLYCLSGGRASAAQAQLNRLGYGNVVNLGGIGRWKGELEKGGGES